MSRIKLSDVVSLYSDIKIMFIEDFINDKERNKMYSFFDKENKLNNNYSNNFLVAIIYTEFLNSKIFKEIFICYIKNFFYLDSRKKEMILRIASKEDDHNFYESYLNIVEYTLSSLEKIGNDIYNNTFLKKLKVYNLL
ncbi:hypothetical protein [Spiroplasma tabanidicola]|uniref:Uncharacterized protein n=1 Tax=Spiroplasma tabanidicola TaxID=324079 RepID=A0A6I6C980_9MOLU|nr:hypothetical protein [Spiroplasma tabanidicola]QGS51436.1 hypothetical protein STABA_v1c00690 [Spiroplasma tabanidicola]QGS51451.1 hypothetical protein STABA_v1c00840 [Spiroplasma tabanidicola]